MIDRGVLALNQGYVDSRLGDSPMAFIGAEKGILRRRLIAVYLPPPILK